MSWRQQKHLFLHFHYWDYLTNFWHNNWWSLIDIQERLCYEIWKQNNYWKFLNLSFSSDKTEVETVVARKPPMQIRSPSSSLGCIGVRAKLRMRKESNFSDFYSKSYLSSQPGLSHFKLESGGAIITITSTALKYTMYSLDFFIY